MIGRKWWPAILIAALLIFSIVLILAVPVVPLEAKLLGLLIIWISLLPVIVYLERGEYSTIPFFPAVGAFYFVFFGLAVFTYPFNDSAPGLPLAYGISVIDRVRWEPLLLVAAGLALQIVGFVASSRMAGSRLRAFRLTNKMNGSTVKPLLWLLAAGHLAHRFVPALQQLPSIGQFLEPGGYVAFCGLILIWFRGELARTETILLASIFLLEVYARIRILFLTDILLFLIFLMFVVWKAQRFRVMAGLIVVSLLVLFSYGATIIVRDSNATFATNLYHSAKALMHVTLLGERHLTNRDGQPINVVGRFDSLIQRTSHIWIFHRVYDMTPEKVPYWDGRTYMPLLTSMIPRAAFPNKLEERTGAEFGLRYKLIGDSSSGTSINLPWLTELMANFGWVGVLMGMAGFGALMGVLNGWFNQPEQPELEFAVAIPILLPFVYPESNFSVTVGSLPLVFVSLYLYFWLGSICVERLRRVRVNASRN